MPKIMAESRCEKPNTNKNKPTPRQTRTANVRVSIGKVGCHLTNSSSATEAGEDRCKHEKGRAASLCSLERVVRLWGGEWSCGLRHTGILVGTAVAFRGNEPKAENLVDDPSHALRAHPGRGLLPHDLVTISAHEQNGTGNGKGRDGSVVQGDGDDGLCGTPDLDGEARTIQR